MPVRATPRRLLPPVYLVLALGAMAALHLLAPGRRLLDAPWTLFGLLPAALGVAISLAGARGFRRAGTPATPFQTPERLVTTGVYGFVRNPMYLGLVLVLVGVALLLGSLTPWAVVPAFALLLDRRFVRAEEAMLAIRFESAWTAYRGRVRRWL